MQVRSARTSGVVACRGPTGRQTTPAPLPNLFVLNDGRPVQTPADWLERRKELRNAII